MAVKEGNIVTTCSRQWNGLHKDAYVKYIVNDLTKSPITKKNISITGPWGSGKSTVLDTIGDQISLHHGDKFQVVSWKIKHYDKSDHVWSHLLKSVYTEYEKDKGLWGRFTFAFAKYKSELNKNKNLLIIKFIAFIVLVVGGAGIKSVFNSFNAQVDTIKAIFDGIGVMGFVVLFKNELAEVLMPIISTPSSYIDTLTQHFSFPNLKSLDNPKSKIESDMNLLLNIWLSHESSKKLLILVDDLDRMTYKDIANFFEAMNLFIDNDRMQFIIAMESETVACATSEKVDYNGTYTFDWFEKYEVGMKHIDKYVMNAFRMDTDLSIWKSFSTEEHKQIDLEQLNYQLKNELGGIFYDNPRLIYKLTSILEFIYCLWRNEKRLGSELSEIEFDQIKNWLIFTHIHPITSSYAVYLKKSVEALIHVENYEKRIKDVERIPPNVEDIQMYAALSYEEILLCENYASLFFERSTYIKRIKERIVKSK